MSGETRGATARHVPAVCAATLIVLLPGSVRLSAAPADGPSPAASLRQAEDESGHRRMIRALAEVARRTFVENRFLSDARLRRLRQAAARMPAESSRQQRIDLHIALGMEELNLGTLEAAAKHLAAALALLDRPRDSDERIARIKLQYYLGLVSLRRSEIENCGTPDGEGSCSMPLGGRAGPGAEAAREAIRYLRAALREAPPQAAETVAVRWLLHLAWAMSGRDPDSVPVTERAPLSIFAAAEDFPRFVDIAPRLGLDTLDLAGGAIADDFNGDGLVDLVTSTWDPTGNIRYFENGGDGSFIDRTHAAHLDGITGGLNLLQADYDNDGDLDVLVLRGAWLEAAGRHPNSLLRNNGDGTFTDVSFAAGLARQAAPTQTAGWADYDNDGDLDLFVGNETGPDTIFPCELFRNNGDGTFSEVAREAGVENLRFTKGVAWGDYDGDGFPDLYLSNYFGLNRLYRNRGDGTFEDVAERLGVALPRESFPVWFWDVDNDGALDLYVASYPNGVGPARLALVAASYFGRTTGAERARLYLGDGRGGFRDVAMEAGLSLITMPMGANFGDLDNDGFLDFYLGTGYPAYDGMMPNVLYWNRGGRRFADVTFASGLGHLQKGHGVAFADFDNDGDQDVFEQMGGFFPDDVARDALYENPGFGHHWLKVRLVGVRSNRSAIGARLRLEVVEDGVRRQIYRTVTSGGSFGASPLTQHIGLGGATEVDVLEVFWPASGERQVFRGVTADQAIRITEGERDLAPLPQRRIRLR